MTWQVYRLVFRLESPLHIGWRKTGNLMQTRYYVPGRAWWGAVTASLTRWMGGIDYPAVGEWVSDRLRFGYFFPAEDPTKPFYPQYTVEKQAGIVYGKDKLLEAEFERRFLSSLASTAIAAEANASEEGSLHEVEFIKPSLSLNQAVYLVGHLFVGPDENVKVKDDDIEINGISLFTQVIASLQIGAERRYGFGRVSLCRDQCKLVNDIFDYKLNPQNSGYSITVSSTQQPLFAHAITKNQRLNGTIEPLVSREWAHENGPGRQITLLGLYYAPGSVTATETTFVIGRYGIWEQVV